MPRFLAALWLALGAGAAHAQIIFVDDTASGADDAMWSARSFASALKSSVFATKSVSQFSSTMTAVLLSKCT